MSTPRLSFLNSNHISIPNPLTIRVLLLILRTWSLQTVECYKACEGASQD